MPLLTLCYLNFLQGTLHMIVIGCRRRHRVWTDGTSGSRPSLCKRHAADAERTRWRRLRLVTTTSKSRVKFFFKYFSWSLDLLNRPFTYVLILIFTSIGVSFFFRNFQWNLFFECLSSLFSRQSVNGSRELDCCIVLWYCIVAVCFQVWGSSIIPYKTEFP